MLGAEARGEADHVSRALCDGQEDRIGQRAPEGAEGGAYPAEDHHRDKLYAHLEVKRLKCDHRMSESIHRPGDPRKKGGEPKGDELCVRGVDP